MMRFFLLASLVLALAACESSPDVLDTIPDEATEAGAPAPHSGPAPISGATTYACAGGDSFTVTPLGDGARLELDRDGETLTLTRTEATMGAKYVAGRTEVWISEDGAFVVEDEVMVLADCTPASN